MGKKKIIPLGSDRKLSNTPSKDSSQAIIFCLVRELPLPAFLNLVSNVHLFNDTVFIQLPVKITIIIAHVRVQKHLHPFY